MRSFFFNKNASLTLDNLHDTNVRAITIILTDGRRLNYEFPPTYNVGSVSAPKTKHPSGPDYIVGDATHAVTVRVTQHNMSDSRRHNSLFVDFLFDIGEKNMYFVYDPLLTIDLGPWVCICVYICIYIYIYIAGMDALDRPSQPSLFHYDHY